MMQFLLQRGKLILVKTQFKLNEIKDCLEGLNDLSLIDNSMIDYPPKYPVLKNVKELNIENSDISSIHKRFPNIENFTFKESAHDGTHRLILGKSSESFPNLRTVYIDKSGTLTSLEVILERINQFSHLDSYYFKFKVYEASMRDIKNEIPHDVFIKEYKRTPKKADSIRPNTIFIEYY